MKRVYLLILCAFIASSIYAQKNASLNWLGYIRTTYDYSIVEDEDNSNEFDLLLATLGFMADINEYSQVFVFTYANYPANSGSSSRDYFGILDAEIRFKPMKNLKLTMGQFVTPFASENLQSSSKIDFTNRGFVVANSPAYRDIGAHLNYKNDILSITGGVTNGSGMNTFDRNNHKNIVARADVRPFAGMRIAGGASIGKDNAPVDSMANNQKFYCGNISYTIGNLYTTVEGSVKDYLDETTNALYAYARYDIPIEMKLLHWVTPGFRYDFIDHLDSDNRTDRYTFGLSLNFDESKWLSMFRINYELVTSEGESDPADNLIVEFQMRFD